MVDFNTTVSIKVDTKETTESMVRVGQAMERILTMSNKVASNIGESMAGIDNIMTGIDKIASVMSTSATKLDEAAKTYAEGAKKAADMLHAAKRVPTPITPGVTQPGSGQSKSGQIKSGSVPTRDSIGGAPIQAQGVTSPAFPTGGSNAPRQTGSFLSRIAKSGLNAADRLAGVSTGITAVNSALDLIQKTLGKALSFFAESSPALMGLLKLFQGAMQIFFMPFGNMLFAIFRPFVVRMLMFALEFNRQWGPQLYKIGEIIGRGVDKLFGVFDMIRDAIMAVARWFGWRDESEQQAEAEQHTQSGSSQQTNGIVESIGNAIDGLWNNNVQTPIESKIPTYRERVETMINPQFTQPEGWHGPILPTQTQVQQESNDSAMRGAEMIVKTIKDTHEDQVRRDLEAENRRPTPMPTRRKFGDIGNQREEDSSGEWWDILGFARGWG